MRALCPAGPSDWFCAGQLGQSEPSQDFTGLLEKEAPLLSGIANDDGDSRLLVTDFASMGSACLRRKPTENSRIRR